MKTYAIHYYNNLVLKRKQKQFINWIQFIFIILLTIILLFFIY